MTHGTEPSPSSIPQPFSKLPGGLVVFAGDYSHRVPTPIDSVPDGVGVIAAGMVEEISDHGANNTSATFRLVNDFGQAVYAYVSPETLATFSLYLVDGMELSLHGIAIRPYPGAAPYIHVLTVEPLTD